MKELESIEQIYLKKYDILVNPYLTYAQIQQIVNAVIKFDVWAERQQNIELLVLYHTTNLGQENIEKIGHEKLLQSGLIDAVFMQIINIDKIYKAIEYTESTSRALAQIVKIFPERLKEIEEVVKRGSSKK